MNLNIADASWSASLTAGAVLDAFADTLAKVGLNGLALLGDAITGFFRQRNLNKQQDNILRPLLANFADIESSMRESMKDIYTRLSKIACDHLREQYQRQVQDSKEALQNAQRLQSEENVRVSELLPQLDAALERVHTLARHMETLA